jgi:membrane fusion protein, multidrug efflux system
MRPLALLLAAGCADSQAETLVDDAVAVALAPLETAPLARPLRGVGRVRTADDVALAFPFPGIAARVAVSRGQAVREGETLVVLDAAPARAQLAVAESALAKAERDATRATALEGTALSAAQRQDAVTGLEIARANVDAAAFQARRSVLRAPADGVVLDVQVDDGQTLGAGQPVVWFSGAAGWEIELSLPAADALQAVPGTPVTATLAALDARISGTVAERAGGPGAHGAWSLTVALDPVDLPLASGLIATVDLAPAPSDWPAVPFAALAEADGRDAVVYTVADGIARRLPVRIAFLAGDRVALADGPPPGTPIVVSGVPFLADGARVRSDR